MSNYYLEFVLSAYNSNIEFIRNSLAELGEGLEVILLPRGENEKAESFKVNIHTQDPTIIFDTCAQIGKIKSVKIDERS
jgi:dihydroxyacetone kinase-like predicted kinase